jgi:transcriptional regulator with XRE-family HTH domain
MESDRQLLESFAANVRRLRLRRGLTQEQLAEMTDLTPRYVQRLEQAGADPSLSVFAGLIRALKTRPSNLMKPAKPFKRRAGRPSHR